MNHLYEVIGTVLGAAFVGLLAYLMPRVKSWLEVNVENTAYEDILRLVRSFVRAAEQLYKAGYITAESRKKYVKEQLEAEGVEVTDMVDNLIEGEVWSVNRAQEEGGHA